MRVRIVVFAAGCILLSGSLQAQEQADNAGAQQAGVPPIRLTPEQRNLLRSEALAESARRFDPLVSHAESADRNRAISLYKSALRVGPRNARTAAVALRIAELCYLYPDTATGVRMPAEETIPLWQDAVARSRGRLDRTLVEGTLGLARAYRLCDRPCAAVPILVGLAAGLPEPGTPIADSTHTYGSLATADVARRIVEELVRASVRVGPGVAAWVLVPLSTGGQADLADAAANALQLVPASEARLDPTDLPAWAFER